MSKEHDSMVIQQWREWIYALPFDGYSDGAPFAQELEEEGFVWDPVTKQWIPPNEHLP